MITLHPTKDKKINQMMPDELEEYLKKLVRHYCSYYADWRFCDGLDVDTTILVEYAVNTMYEDDDCSESIYKWLDNKTHWIWNIALEEHEKMKRAWNK